MNSPGLIPPGEPAPGSAPSVAADVEHHRNLPGAGYRLNVMALAVLIGLAWLAVALILT